MTLNLFCYFTQEIEDPVIHRARNERHCKCMEESSIYNKQKDQKKENKTDIQQQDEKIVSDWIVLSSHKESFTDLEHIEIYKKLKLPYERKQIFTRWNHSYPNLNEMKSKTFYIDYVK